MRGAQTIVASSSPRRGELVKKIASGKAVATLAFSEKGSRSHFWAPVSRAERNSQGVVLNCDKSFVTSAGHADYYVVSSLAVEAKGPVDSTLYRKECFRSGLGRGLERHRSSRKFKRPDVHSKLSRRCGRATDRRRGRIPIDDGSRSSVVSNRKRCSLHRNSRSGFRRHGCARE
jgi:hypothetical protein